MLDQLGLTGEFCGCSNSERPNARHGNYALRRSFRPRHRSDPAAAALLVVRQSSRRADATVQALMSSASRPMWSC